ncbi:hypothetical protein BH24ACT11_BH24ACT11_01330 [soil metagenome]
MPPSACAESAADAQQQPLILVVDDQLSLRGLIRVNLELEGFAVVEAVDGVDCLEQARRRRPDLITMDIVMPRLDGLATAAELRADPALCDVPIVMVTTSGQPQDLQRARAAGVEAYLTKPYDPDELVETVQRLLVSPH